MKRFVKISTLCVVVTLLAAMLCAPAGALGNAATTQIVGHGAVGEGVGKHTTLIDFADSDLGGFAPFAGTETLNLGASAVWGTNVLKTRLSSPESETGMKKTFSDASALAATTTLSVQQVAQASAYTVTLRLSGIDQNNAPLSWEATVAVTTNQWQTVTFDISSFVSLVNKNAPVTMALLASADGEASIGAEWMIKSIYVSVPQGIPELLLPAATAVCGFAVGFALFFVIYRTTCKKNRRPRWEER